MSKYLKYLKSLRVQLLLGAALVAIGLLIVGTNWLNTDRVERSAIKPQPIAKVLISNKTVENSQPVVSGMPVHISIPSVAIDLKVIPGYYYPASNSWTLSLNDAQYGVMTAKPNNKEGDTFIYAHARIGLFHNLPKIQTGAEAIITTDSGHTFTYTFQASSITSPDDTSLFNYKGKPILILQTCTGAQFQNRQLFVFNLSQVS